MGAVRRHVSDSVAWLELDVPGRSLNTISRAVRDELQACLDWVRDDATISAAVLISGKPHHFMAGADIEEFVALQTRSEAVTLSRSGQDLINQIESGGKPFVAAIHGACLGGGLEAALACHYRIATDHPNTMLGVPEIQLGIIPAAGGCQRLPRLIGLRRALDIILAGRKLRARQALELGLVDELVHPAILREIAAQVARRLGSGWRPRRKAGGVAGLVFDRNAVGRKVVLSQARKAVRKKTGGHYPAPVAALDAVEHGINYGVQAGLDSEAAHFAELALGDVSRNLVRIFFGTTALKKDPGVEGEGLVPAQVSNVGVVGAGFMGSAIAGVAVASAGVDVRLKDTSLEQVAKGLVGARGIVDENHKRRYISKYEHRRLVSLLSGGTDWAGFGRADLVVEAVYEDLAVKREVMSALETVVGSKCILATNTSTIPVSRIAEVLRHPERTIGMHFFSPVEKMPLLEVIVAQHTSPEVVVTAVAFGKAMGKTVIVVRDAPGFYVNRILAPYLNEAGRMLQEGVTVKTIDDTMRQFGFPVGPVALLDEVGLDVAEKASEVLHEAFGDRMLPVNALSLMTQAGWLGRKNKRGFYTYHGKAKKKVDPRAMEIVGAKLAPDVPQDDVRRRLIYSMLNEAVRALDDGVVRSARDADIGAVFGLGFPPFRGGPFRYLDALGPSHVVAVLRELRDKYGDRFQPADRLEEMAKDGQTFHLDS